MNTDLLPGQLLMVNWLAALFAAIPGVCCRASAAWLAAATDDASDVTRSLRIRVLAHTTVRRKVERGQPWDMRGVPLALD